MRISITGVSQLQDDDLIDRLTKRWPNYIPSQENFYTPDDMTLVNSQEEQWESLNSMIDVMQEYRNNDHIVYRGCPLDNIVYSIWANAKGYDIDDDYIQKCLPVVSESMRFLDIIFYIPNSGMNEIELNEQYDELQNLYTAVTSKWSEESSPFYPRDDRPALIEIFGNVETQLEMISLYMDENGDSIEAQGIINPNEIEDLEKAFGLK